MRRSGSSTSSTRTPQTTPRMSSALGWKAGASAKKVSEVGLARDLLLEPRLRIPGQPAEDLVDLPLRPPLLLRLLDVEGVDAGELHTVDAVWGHAGTSTEDDSLRAGAHVRRQRDATASREEGRS